MKPIRLDGIAPHFCGADALPSPPDLLAADASLREMIALPQQLIDGYDQQRQKSELGQIYRISHFVHDYVDAVVIVGGPACRAGVAAILRGCSHPYHNETSRGVRGSKPRFYFVDPTIDNDALHGLLDRLRCNGGDNPAGNRFVVVAMDDDRFAPPATLDVLMQQLQHQCRNTDQKATQLVYPITRPGTPLANWAHQQHPDNCFARSSQLSGSAALLGTVGILPAALVGRDCNMLLRGAMAISTHFQQTPPTQNMVLQLGRALRLVLSMPRFGALTVRHHNEALRPIEAWLAQRLLSPQAPPPRLSFKTPSLQNVDAVVDVRVEQPRTDPLSVSDAALAGTADTMAYGGDSLLRIALPEISEYTLGQYLQLLNLASSVAWRLAS